DDPLACGLPHEVACVHRHDCVGHVPREAVLPREGACDALALRVVGAPVPPRLAAPRPRLPPAAAGPHLEHADLVAGLREPPASGEAARAGPADDDLQTIPPHAPPPSPKVSVQSDRTTRGARHVPGNGRPRWGVPAPPIG